MSFSRFPTKRVRVALWWYSSHSRSGDLNSQSSLSAADWLTVNRVSTGRQQRANRASTGRQRAPTGRQQGTASTGRGVNREGRQQRGVSGDLNSSLPPTAGTYRSVCIANEPLLPRQQDRLGRPHKTAHYALTETLVRANVYLRTEEHLVVRCFERLCSIVSPEETATIALTSQRTVAAQ